MFLRQENTLSITPFILILYIKRSSRFLEPFKPVPLQLPLLVLCNHTVAASSLGFSFTVLVRQRHQAVPVCNNIRVLIGFTVIFSAIHTFSSSVFHQILSFSILDNHSIQVLILIMSKGSLLTAEILAEEIIEHPSVFM